LAEVGKAVRDYSQRTNAARKPVRIASRYLIEIEIKRSISDFKADALKPSRRCRDLYPKKFPKQFYYLVLPEMVEKIEPLLPAWAGLMRGPTDQDTQCVHVVKTAPTNHESQRLSTKECAKLVYKMANQIVSMSNLLNRQAFWDDSHGWDFRIEFEPSYSNFQI
jgi:hypothetical protein